MQAKKILIIISCIALALMLALLLVPGTGLGPTGPQKPTVYILYSTAGSMPQLLNTGQVDAFFVWQPYVAMADQGHIGKIIVYSEELPPNHSWVNATCCVFVMDDRFIEREPEIATMLSSLTTAAIQYIHDNPNTSISITSKWLFGTKGDVLIAGKYLDPISIETESFPTLRFVNASPAFNASNYSALSLPAVTRTGRDMSRIPARLAVQENENAATPEHKLPVIRFGYLSTDHHAPLFVLAMEPAYFQERYGLALVPASPGGERPNLLNLVSHNITVAQVQLIPGQSGGGLMTNMGQGAIDAAYLGSVPADLQISLGNPAHVIQPLHTGGSALVVSSDKPWSTWNDFTAWARTRSAAKDPVIVATVQSSIQETMIRGAFESEGFVVILYGT